jgi:hypothetical protein
VLERMESLDAEFSAIMNPEVIWANQKSEF